MPGVPLTQMAGDLRMLAALGERHGADVYLGAPAAGGPRWRVIVTPRSGENELEVRGNDWDAVVAAAVQTIREVG